MLVVLIMAGGKGKRFWPLSTPENPKQFLKFIDREKSMLKKTVERILPLFPIENIFIGTNENLIDKVKRELPKLPKRNIISEPSSRNTAAAIGYGIIKIKEVLGSKNINGNLNIIVLPADHIIKEEENFREELEKAIERVKSKKSIVTFGIKPNKPEVNYGYIEVENKIMGKINNVKRFCEKPNLERAKEYVETQNFLWNSGMFVFNADMMMKEFKNYLPKHYKILEKLSDTILKNNEELLKKKFDEFEKISIDFGILEKTSNVEVIPVEFGWNDVGSLTALDDIFEKNNNGSIERCGELKEYKSKNNIVIGSNHKEVVLVGIEDTIIVETKDKILVCKKSEVKKIKEIIS